MTSMGFSRKRIRKDVRPGDLVKFNHSWLVPTKRGANAIGIYIAPGLIEIKYENLDRDLPELYPDEL